MATATKQAIPPSGAVWSAAYAAGMSFVFVGEKLIGSGSGRAISVVGILLVVLAFAMRLVRARGVTAERRSVEQIIAAVYGLGLFALVLYGLQSDLGGSVFGQPLGRSAPKLAGALAALWPAVWLPAALALVLVELSLASVWRAPRLELGRVYAALGAGLGLGAAIVFAASSLYVGTERNKRVDFSYFRTARPGEATHKIVRQLNEKVTVYLFFPPANEAADEVTSYFDDLKNESVNLDVQRLDQAIAPAKAKELGVNANGTVVFSKGARKEPLFIGVDLDSARGPLRNLDKDVQKRLLQVGRPAKNVYLIIGHEERAFDNVGEANKRGTIRDLREGLGQLGYVVKTLGAVDGLANEIPADAALVMWVGPQRPLLAEEEASLQRYFDRGGRLYLALDPDSKVDGGELLKSMGLKLRGVTLASDLAYLKPNPYSIMTATFSSHASVSTIQKQGGRAPVVLPIQGSLEEIKDRKKDLGIDITMRAHVSTWDDKDGNQRFDAGPETRKAWELSAAVTRKGASGKPEDESRALVIAGSGWVADGSLGYAGNQLFLVDGIRWLLGEESIIGETSTEVDAPIAHTSNKDKMWFYSTVFLIPALVLGIGYFVTRRGRRSSGSRKSNPPVQK